MKTMENVTFGEHAKHTHTYKAICVFNDFGKPDLKLLNFKIRENEDSPKMFSFRWGEGAE